MKLTLYLKQFCGSGSTFLKSGSADEDPDQSVVDSQHWFKVLSFLAS